MSRKSKKRRQQYRGRRGAATAVAERIAPESVAPVASAPESMIRLAPPVEVQPPGAPAPRRIDAEHEKAAHDGEAAVAIVSAVVHGLTEALGIPDECRTFARVALHVEIDMHSESHFFSGLAGDVSEGGLFVQTYRPLEVGDGVVVSFDLEGERIETWALVRWHREGTAECEPGFGLAFEGLTEREQSLIQAFCAKRAPLYYDV